MPERKRQRHTRFSGTTSAFSTSAASRLTTRVTPYRALGIALSRHISVLSGAFSEEFGAAALSHLLSAKATPTAVFAASDMIALGLLGAARRLGISVPGDLSIVGFDDLPAAAIVTPRLTTVRTPVATMAETAVSMLVDRLNGAVDGPRTTVTSVSLIVGQSTAALPAV